MLSKRHLLSWITAWIISGTAAETIVVAGSDTMGGSLMPKLGEAYRKERPEVEIKLITDGSSSAFEHLLARTALIGMSSRPVSRNEEIAFLAKGLRLIEHEAAWDMLCVIVNDNNLLENLTLKQVESIFAGDITDWSEVGGQKGPIGIYTRQPVSGTYRSFQELALANRDYSDESKQLAGNKEIADKVAQEPNAIGYVGHSYLDREGIRAVKIDGVSPETEKKAEFPLSRRLYYYTIDEPRGEALRFLEWAVKSPNAHKMIREVGFLPIDVTLK